MSRPPIPFTAGVVREYTPGSGRFAYFGTADDVVAAGLVKRCDLPSQPGNRRTMVTLHADGRRVIQGTTKGCGWEPGKKQIMALPRKDAPGGVLFQVLVTLHPDQVAELDAEHNAQEAERIEAAKSWPFPVSAHRALEAAA